MGPNTRAAGSRSAMPLYIAAASLLILTQLWAAPSINIAINPVNYGQNDKITATTSPLSDPITLYLNNTLVGNATKTVNYTICKDGPCMLPGSYPVTAIDLSTKQSTVLRLVVEPQYPSFTVQSYTVKYGRADTITALPGAYNDSMEIVIDGSTVASGNGDITYTICGNVTQNEQCLPIGTHSVGVIDVSQGVSSQDNRTINVTPSIPSVSIQPSSAAYGAEVNITVTSPTATDQVAIMYGTTTLASGTGNFTYTICGVNASTPCLPPATYPIYVYDQSQNINSTSRNLTITSQKPSVSIAHTVISYGEPDRISVTAPNINDGLVLAINGALLATGTGNVSYTLCGSIYNANCTTAGKNILSVTDTAEAYTANYTLTVTPVLPSIDISPLTQYSGKPVSVSSTAPYYKDDLMLMINGAAAANGTGALAYTICADNYINCLPAGTYKVSVYDRSENANSTLVSLSILAPGGSATSAPTTSAQSSTTTAGLNATTTAQAGGSSGRGSGLSSIITIAVVVAIIVFAFLLIKSRLMFR